MERRGRARAPAAGTILNALATGTGAAFAIDRYTEATVALGDRPIDADAAGDRSESAGSDGFTVVGEIAGEPDADTRLVERCVSLVVETYGDDDSTNGDNGDGDSGNSGRTNGVEYGRVRTESDIAMAAGLKSSSAAANATMLATLNALGIPIAGADEPAAETDEPVVNASGSGGSHGPNGTDRTDGTDETGSDAPSTPVTRLAACRLGVRAARETGVTVTGAFDDASASMLGGVTVTNNSRDELLAHDTGFERAVAVRTPPERAYSADADIERCRRVAPVAEVVANRGLAGEYERAMTTNGFAYCAALGYSPEPMVEALEHVRGVSLSGTGPSVVTVGDSEAVQRVQGTWSEREGHTWLTRTETTGARIA
jgi:shikimate kinase